MNRLRSNDTEDINLKAYNQSLLDQEIDDMIRDRLYKILYHNIQTDKPYTVTPLTREEMGGAYLGGAIDKRKLSSWQECLHKMKGDGIHRCDLELYYDDVNHKCTYPKKFKEWDAKSRACKQRERERAMGGSAWTDCLHEMKGDNIPRCDLELYYDKINHTCTYPKKFKEWDAKSRACKQREKQRKKLKGGAMDKRRKHLSQWNKFVKDHKHEGLNMTEMANLYRKQTGR